jgi:hypothetical protein
MAVCFVVGWVVAGLGWPRGLEMVVQAMVLATATVFICFTWPNLEATISEGEPGSRLQRLLGIYNLVWSGAGALAYFTGGWLIERLGMRHQVFLVPAMLIGGQWALVMWLERQPGARGPHLAATHGPLASVDERRRSTVSPRVFLWMSWLANPCAYIAIAAAIPMIPSLAEKLGMTPGVAGFFCSIWLFARTLTFGVLWGWSGWHYRFGWLVTAFVGMTAGFLAIFLAPGLEGLGRSEILVVATLAQVGFGVGLGLIYYSSLFYSMDVGDTKGDHGGIHEAAIGAGIMGGPLVGVVAQVFRPGSTTAAAWAVTGVLAAGLGVIIWMRQRGDPGGMKRSTDPG